jgi:hypothetical protein
MARAAHKVTREVWRNAGRLLRLRLVYPRHDHPESGGGIHDVISQLVSGQSWRKTYGYDGRGAFRTRVVRLLATVGGFHSIKARLGAALRTRRKNQGVGNRLPQDVQACGCEGFLDSHVYLVGTGTDADLTRLQWALSAPGGISVVLAMPPRQSEEAAC